MKPRCASFLRMLLGIALLPFCWAVSFVLFDSIVKAAGASGGVTVESFSLLAGMAAFSLSWMALAHPVKTYILGHELTHALWGILFGAKPSRLRVGESGGSVNLTKSNVFITLAPYFFPFYTFVVIVSALILSFFVDPLPCLPLWMFMIGYTWAFHVLFTCETLTRRQPDVGLYGRIFSWVFIYIVNVLIVLVWLSLTTSLELAEVLAWTWSRACGAYGGLYGVISGLFSWLWGLFF
jgi:hypothetical protein